MHIQIWSQNIMQLRLMNINFTLLIKISSAPKSVKELCIARNG